MKPHHRGVVKRVERYLLSSARAGYGLGCELGCSLERLQQSATTLSVLEKVVLNLGLDAAPSGGPSTFVGAPFRQPTTTTSNEATRGERKLLSELGSPTGPLQIVAAKIKWGSSPTFNPTPFLEDFVTHRAFLDPSYMVDPFVIHQGRGAKIHAPPAEFRALLENGTSMMHCGSSPPMRFPRLCGAAPSPCTKTKIGTA